MAYDLHRIDCASLIERRRQEWFNFAERCSIAAPFCRPATWMAWFEIFVEFDPVIYELREQGELRALLPLYQQGMTLRLATDGQLDYQDIEADSHESAVALLEEVLRREASSGVVLTFAKVAENSRLFAVLQDERIARHASVQRRYWSLCPATRFALREPGNFLRSLSSRQRKDYNASSRRISEAFPDHRTEHRFGSEIDLAILEAAAELHLKNQYRKEGDSVFCDSGFLEFLRRQAECGAPLLLSMVRQSEAGAPLAFNLGFFSGDTYFYYLTAYDGQQSALSPGRRLLVDSLGYCADRAIGEHLRFDLLSGEESYKTRWASSFYEVYRFQVIPRRLTNLPRLAAYSTIYGLKSAKNRLRSRLGQGASLAASLEHESPALPN